MIDIDCGCVEIMFDVRLFDVGEINDTDVDEDDDVGEGGEGKTNPDFFTVRSKTPRSVRFDSSIIVLVINII